MGMICLPATRKPKPANLFTKIPDSGPMIIKPIVNIRCDTHFSSIILNKASPVLTQFDTDDYHRAVRIR